MTARSVPPTVRAAGLEPFAAYLMLTGCTASKKAQVYSPPDYASWKRTTDVILNYPIPGHQDRLRIPRMNAIGFGATPVLEGGKRRWVFPDGTIIVKEVFKPAAPAPGESSTADGYSRQRY